MSIELIGNVPAPVPARAVSGVFAQIGADPKYDVLFESDGTLKGKFRSLVHAASEREDFELSVRGPRVVLSCYSGTLGDIETAQRDVERFFANEGLVVCLEEE